MAGIGNLQSILTSSEKNHLIKNTGEEIGVEYLKRKTVLLYLAYRNHKADEFLQDLREAYEIIKILDPAFEIVYICSDPDGYKHGEFFSMMPWLAVPRCDERGKSIAGKFMELSMNNKLLAFGRDGEMVTEDAREFVTLFGADAHPFTEQHLKGLQERWPATLPSPSFTEEHLKRLQERWPATLPSPSFHHHTVELTRLQQNYRCEVCFELTRGWSYCCRECDFIVQPQCVFGGITGWKRLEGEIMNQLLGLGATSSKRE